MTTDTSVTAPKVRNPSDLVGLIACALGIVLVCLMTVYAHNTTEGISEDVRAFAILLQRILFVPVAVLDMIVVLFPPIAVGIDLLIRRHPMTALQGLLGALGGIMGCLIAVFLLNMWGSYSLVAGLSIHQGATDMLTIPTYVAAITALLTAVASPASRPSVTWSWNLLWISVAVAVVTSATSLPGMAIALLLGRLMGYAARYGLGVVSQRAYGAALVKGIQRAGFSPVSIDRVSTVEVPETQTDAPGVQSPQFFSDHRLYVMRTAAGKLYNVIVLDGDRQVMSALSRIWRYLRSRAVEGGAALSLRQTAERTALLSYAVRSAGVSTPAVLSIAEAEASMLIVREATRESVCFADLTGEQVTDDILDAMWQQILKAHRCGIVHRALTPDCFRLASSETGVLDRLWVLGWEAGDVASSQLARRVDLTQLVALITTKVGPARALASASRALDERELASLGPLLQVPAVPRGTRSRMGNAKAVLAQLRTELQQDVPETETEPEQITRFGMRTVVMTILMTIAVIVILTTFNLGEVVHALRNSDWRWAVAAFAAGMVGFVGASVSFMSFSPVKLSFWRVYACQLAAAFVAVAAPAGLGPAAINLRVLMKKDVPTPVAAATVALTQLANIAVVTLSLVVVAVITGSSQLSSFQVTPGMIIAVLVVAAAVGAILLVPRSRRWVSARVMPLVRQTGPRLVEVLSSPHRIVFGILGNVLVVAAYVTALQWAVYAFGHTVPVLGAAMVYLFGTSAGSVTPTPGGMGAVELAESATLVTLGINAGVAASIVLLFRIVTYWLRIPLGWVAYRWMRGLGEL